MHALSDHLGIKSLSITLCSIICLSYYFFKDSDICFMNGEGVGINRALDSLKLESQEIVNDLMWVLGTERRSSAGPLNSLSSLF